MLQHPILSGKRLRTQSRHSHIKSKRSERNLEDPVIIVIIIINK